MKNEKQILLADVNEFITCVLCKGYLIDATTITECLHTCKILKFRSLTKFPLRLISHEFKTVCKKCIVEYLEENTNCPICDTLLHQSHPLLYIAHDRTLQSIVYKLVPNLEKDELDRQLKYYDENKLEYPKELKEKLDQFSLTSKQNDKNNNFNSEKPVSSTSQNNSSSSYHRQDEQIALSLEPLEGLQVWA